MLHRALFEKLRSRFLYVTFLHPYHVFLVQGLAFLTGEHVYENHILVVSLRYACDTFRSVEACAPFGFHLKIP